MKTIKICGGCGKPLAPDMLLGLCPQCMMKAGAAPTTGERLPALAAPLPGAIFGGYRIIRLLGEGGMGAAYEAEDLENGRRVALKVLRHAPESPTARQRFLREGRLAASVNHPNTVYIFGSEEIEGAPVITMEYVSGGTLSERVKHQGPMPVNEAVDAILQVIAGLEAAGDKGVLHRDVKPSNCFVEADGTVKVGDFGLSISTLARDQTALTMAGSIMGTPEYASPEQLRGDELDARADIYSVGVTLYFLLTGKTPFHGENMVGLIATVLEKPAPPLRSIRRDIPKGVEQIVLRCLAKQPRQRFKNYEQLRAALLPFCSTAPTPATFGRRVVAGIIETVFWSSLFAYYFPKVTANPFGIDANIYYAVSLLYWAVLEGFWGVSLGKWICRLRVIGPDRDFPGFARALARALLFWIVPFLPQLFLGWMGKAEFGPDHPWLTLAFWSSGFLILLLMFVTARRRNGFAALHDLLTGTRVIELAAYQRRPKFTATEDTAPHTSDAPTIGQFHVLDSLARDDRSEILLGYDTRLLRKVWIRKQPPGTAPVAALQRDLTRKGRQHWLASRRSETECWDVYEALPGQPLVNLLNQPQPWKSVCYWLHDLAEEFEAARLDGSLPDTLELNRVWITAEGRARLLDFAVPGASTLVTQVSQSQAAGTDSPPVLTTPQQFLNQVAHVALSGRARPVAVQTPVTEQVRSFRLSRRARPAAQTDTPQVPLPISARSFLKMLPTAPDVHAALLQLRPLLDKAAAVSRARRLTLLLGCIAPVLMISGSIWIFQENIKQKASGEPGLGICLYFLSGLQNHPANPGDITTNMEYNAIQVYVVSRFLPSITNDTFWANAAAQQEFWGADMAVYRRLAEQALAAHPVPSAVEIREAQELIHRSTTRLGSYTAWQNELPQRRGAILANVIMLYTAMFSMLLVLLFRRGLLFCLLGIEIVTRNGLPARRWRTFLRSLLTWLPLVFLCYSTAIAVNLGGGPALLFVLVMLMIVIGGAVYALICPERGLQDRLAGTWLVS